MKTRAFNSTTIIGTLIAIGTIYFGGIKTVKNPMMFLDLHAILLVVGGTVAAAMIAYPWANLSQVIDFIMFGVFRIKQTNYVTLIEEFADIHQAVISNDQQILYRQFSHPFIAESVTMLMKKGLTEDELETILQDRVLAFNKRYLQDAKILNAIAKYPPAFGLLGATTGMISMMTNLGGFGGAVTVGQAMAVALVATFWGIALANFVFLPLADNAQKSFQNDEFTRNFIKEGALLIKSNANRRFLVERLSSMLPIELRGAARGSFGTFPNSGEQINVVEIFAKQKKKQVELKQHRGTVTPDPDLDPHLHRNKNEEKKTKSDARPEPEVHIEKDVDVESLNLDSDHTIPPVTFEEVRKQYNKRSNR